MGKINPKVTAESREQITLFEWAELNKGRFPELSLLFHIPNGGKRAITTAVRLKMEGVKAGVPDLFLPVARGGFHGLFIEMKVKGNGPTENQERWLRALEEQGFFCAVSYGWENAAEILKEYLKNRG